MTLKRNKRIECADGFSMSVQASSHNYCSPRVDNAPSYDEVEVGFPNSYEPLLTSYAEDKENYTGTVYGWVPVGVVTMVCAKHGGIISGELPNGIPYLKAEMKKSVI